MTFWKELRLLHGGGGNNLHPPMHVYRHIVGSVLYLASRGDGAAVYMPHMARRLYVGIWNKGNPPPHKPPPLLGVPYKNLDRGL